jgi:dihydroxyacetone kinase-like protein
MKIGGASGPLYGSLLMEMGKAAPPDGRDPTLEDALRMLTAGIEGVKRRGKSDRGEKTMLDVLCPVADALEAVARSGEGETAATRVLSAAAFGLHRTGSMLATKGRASFLGERSKGHIDPGACSSALLIGAVIGVLEQEVPA